MNRSRRRVFIETHGAAVAWLTTNNQWKFITSTVAKRDSCFSHLDPDGLSVGSEALRQALDKVPTSTRLFRSIQA